MVGSLLEAASRSKNCASVMSTRSLKVSLPNSTFRGTTSMPYRSRHSSGRSAVESVTTAKGRFTDTGLLFDGEDEGVVLLAAVLDLDFQAGVARANGGFQA